MLLLLVMIVTTAGGYAQSAGKQKFPVPFGPTNSGTDFWLSFPANWEFQATQKYVRLYITAGTKTKVNVWTGPNLLKTIYTVPYDVVTVDLPQYEAQAGIVRDDAAPVPDDQIYPKRAVHVESEAPIVVYGINRTNYTSDGMLALPLNALGKEYVVASARDIADGTVQKLPSQYMIIAPYDNTSVQILNPKDTPNHKAGERFTINMMKGDVFSAMSIGFGGDLSGSYILANKPIAVTAGQNCTYLPDQNYPACDHLEEMMLPVSSWGKFYHSVPYATRRKADLFRIFAGDNNAKIYINGTLYATLATKGGEEGVGWLEYLPLIRENIEFTSDKPIYVGQYNNSQNYDGVATDPFYLVLTPVEQYQTQLVFTTPAKDFPQNYINLVCDSTALFGIEIAPGGTNKWEKLTAIYGADSKPFPTKIYGQRYVGKTFLINPGTYRMRGPKPFAGYIYGYGSYDSYGYPLSVAVGDLTKPLDIDAPVITGTPDCFGTILNGVVTDKPDSDAIRSNLSSIFLDTASYNYDLKVKDFTAGNDQSTTYTLTVVDRTQDAQAVIVASDMRGNSSYDTVRYSAFNVDITPSPADLGTITVGDKKTGQLTITNKSARSITIKRALLKDGAQGFVLLSPAGSFVLGPAGSPTDKVTADVEFTATKSGRYEDSLGLEDECGLRYLALIRANVGRPIIHVTDKDFGKQPVTTTTPGQIEIRNESTDGGTLVVTGGSGPDVTAFTLPNGLPAFPLTLKQGESQPLNVNFRPDLPQKYIDSIYFTHNAPPDPANKDFGELRGEGTNSSMLATPYKWPAIRVPNDWPNAPFVPATVELKNLGNSPIRVVGIKAKRGGPLPGDVADFFIDESQLQGVQLAGGASITVNVGFKPPRIGTQYDTIVYETVPAQESEVVTYLEGSGYLPALTTVDYDFGSMPVGGAEVPKKIAFELAGTHMDPGKDAVTITGFRFTSDQANGLFDFRADLPAPVTLVPGTNDKLEFDGFFQAHAAGLRNASVTAISSDSLDPSISKTTSNWTGTGDAVQGGIIATAKGDTVRGICTPGSGLLQVVLGNDASAGADMEVTGLKLSGVGGDFTIIDPDPNTPFTLKPGQTKTIQVRYSPSAKGEQKGTVDVLSATGRILGIPILGSSSEVEAAMRVKLTAEHELVELGKDLTATVVLDTATIDKVGGPLNTQNYTVTLNYDPKQLQPRTGPADIKLGTPVNAAGATATVNAAATAAGKLVIDISSPSPLSGYGDLISVPFGVIFTTDSVRSVTADVAVNDIGCATIDVVGDTIGVLPICGLNLRIIELTNGSYTLDQNSPNPFNPTTKISYSLGLDGPTKMLLYDDKGTLVQVLVDEYQQPGRYELTLDVSNLPSGVYYYTIVSGTWKQTRRMTVLK
jgi:hypothetical protein